MKKYNKILLIDDDSITNFINSSVIRNIGLGEVIKVVTNGREAISYLKKDCCRENIFPDFILLDINMPGMDGYEFWREYRKLDIKEAQKATIMMLTTSTSPRDIEKAEKLGILILRKPLRKKMIMELFEESEGV
jgi:CheY-like chemotaxis protein